LIARCLLLVTPLLIALLRIWWLFKVAGIDRATTSGSTLRKILVGDVLPLSHCSHSFQDFLVVRKAGLETTGPPPPALNLMP